MQVTLIKENKDGSADYNFDMTEEEKNSLVLFGLRRALEDALKHGDEWKSPDDVHQMELLDEQQ